MEPAERAALLLARIHDAAADLLVLSVADPTLRRLRVPLEQVHGAAMRAARKLDDSPTSPRG